MKQFLKNNGLSLVFFLLFMITLCGQAITGLKEHNEEMIEDGGHAIGMGEYLTSGHFIQATFEIGDLRMSQSKPIDAPNDETGD